MQRRHEGLSGALIPADDAGAPGRRAPDDGALAQRARHRLHCRFMKTFAAAGDGEFATVVSTEEVLGALRAA
jgi:hypothetical protein